MTFVLTYACVITGNFLVGAGNNKIRRVHSNQVGSELTGKMILFFVMFPVKIGIKILGFFQRVSDVTLSHAKIVRQYCRNQITIRIIAH